MHSLVINSDAGDDGDIGNLATNCSPRPHPTPSSFRSDNSQKSYIKRQRYPAFRKPASPPQPVAPHWNRLVSPSIGLNPVFDNFADPPSPLVSSSGLSSSASHETDTESPVSLYTPADDKWGSVTYEDSAILTSGHHEACAQFNGELVEDCFGLCMPMAPSTKSISDAHLIAPPNSPMMGHGCLRLPPSPQINLDELELYFPGPPAPSSATSLVPLTTPASSKIQIHRRFLHSLTLRRIKSSVQQRVEAQTESFDNNNMSKKALSLRSRRALRQVFHLGAGVAQPQPL